MDVTRIPFAVRIAILVVSFALFGGIFYIAISFALHNILQTTAADGGAGTAVAVLGLIAFLALDHVLYRQESVKQFLRPPPPQIVPQKSVMQVAEKPQSITPIMRKWVEDNHKIGYTRDQLKAVVAKSGYDPSVVDKILGDK